MINPKKELFKWGPIDGRPIYIVPFVDAFVLYPKFIDGTWPDTLGFFKNDRIVFVLGDKDLRDKGEHLFKKYILNEKEIKKAYNEWEKTVTKLRDFEKKVNEGISKGRLNELFVKWHEAHVDFWVKIFLPELSNWGAERLLKRKLSKFSKKDFIEILEGLSAPEDTSFFQKEELEFMKIKLIDNKEKQLKKLEEHQKKYYWLRNDYAFTRVLDLDYFKDELKKISKENAKRKIDELNNYTGKVKQRKKEIIKKYGIDEEIANIARKLAYCVWWQDFRKQFIFIANHITTKFLKEIEKIKGIPFKELCYYCPNEIIGLLSNNKRIDVNPRFGGFVVYYHEKNGITYKIGREANDFMKPYLEVKVDPNIEEIKGLVVSKGKQSIVRGRVKILLAPKNTGKIKQGDILVAPMTSPDYVMAMRKASAVITDVGGMTSHAAIVSRELKIPCIVGTKIATKVLKDGDLVEVDADKGIVKRVK